MADFRKYALAIAGLACTFGVTNKASAQSFNGFSCVANASTPFDMRAEGITEQAGDIVLSCTGGTVTPVTNAAGVANTIPQVNITVSTNTNITSRLINGSSTVTEALLLVNEPQANNVGICPAAGSTVANQCLMTPLGVGGGNTTLTYNPGTAPGPRYNGFQGTLVSASQITFFGVAIDPPGPAASATTTAPVLTLRITNIRANASALGAPTGFSVNSVFETISTSAGFPISNNVQTVGTVRRGLVVTTVTGATNSTSTTPGVLQQCTTQTAGSFVETINFGEGFGTATKLQTPLTGIPTTPGNLGNAESQFIPTYGTGRIGVADFATRIKITFTNIPTGVTLYVPTTVNSNQVVSTGGFSETLTLTSSEGGSFSAVSPTTGVTSLPANYAAITATSGTATAVYEVTFQSISSPATIETFSVPVVVTYTAAPATNSPALGTSSIAVDFAPTSTVVTAAASPVPRFVQTSTPANGFIINACQTVLLFPFASNLAGFDTGLAIASTSTDPFGTAAQNGTCTMNFYGTAAPAAFVTPTVNAGTAYTNLLSTVAPGFQGYIIAQCRFQYAHGFAFITDGFGGPGRGLSQGYLALVIPDPGTTSGKRGANNVDVAPVGSGEGATN